MCAVNLSNTNMKTISNTENCNNFIKIKDKSMKTIIQLKSRIRNVKTETE